MKNRLAPLLLCMLLLCAALSCACGEELPEVPEGWEPVRIADLFTPEMKELEVDDDRAGGFFTPAEPVPEDTGDRVVIQNDGSFEIVSGVLRLAGPQPFGWVYYTQSFQAQPEVYTQNPDLLKTLTDSGIHLFLKNSADNVLAFLLLEDDLGLLPLMENGEDLEGAMRTSGMHHRFKYRTDVRNVTFGGCPYLVITDAENGFSVYETVIGDIPVSLQVYYYDGFTELFERFLEETVMSELSLAIVAL